MRVAGCVGAYLVLAAASLLLGSPGLQTAIISYPLVVLGQSWWIVLGVALYALVVLAGAGAISGAMLALHREPSFARATSHVGAPLHEVVCSACRSDVPATFAMCWRCGATIGASRPAPFS